MNDHYTAQHALQKKLKRKENLAQVYKYFKSMLVMNRYSPL